MFNYFVSIDNNILRFIHNNLTNSTLDKIMPLITSLGNMGLVWIVISIILIVDKRYRHIGLMCISALILANLVGEDFLKNIIQRPRPFIQIPDFKLLIAKPSSYSFPSGHTASGFAVAGILWSTIKGTKRVYVIVLASLIAFSRLYLYVHYPSDVLAGILVGLICSRIVLMIYRNKFS